MTTRTGIGTLANVGGIVAAVVCVLVGIQLLLLAGEIGALAAAPASGAQGLPPAEAWRALIRVSAWLSLLAGSLVALLVAAHRPVRGRSGTDSGRPDADGIEDVTVRIYEFEGSGGAVEVTPESSPSVHHLDRPHLAKSGLEPTGDESARILAEVARLSDGTSGRARPAWRSLLRRFRRPRGRS